MPTPRFTYVYRVEPGMDDTAVFEAVRYRLDRLKPATQDRHIIGPFGSPERAFDCCTWSSRLLISRLQIGGRTARVIVEEPRELQREFAQS